MTGTHVFRTTCVSLTRATVYDFTTTDANVTAVSASTFDASGNAYIATNNGSTTLKLYKIVSGSVSYNASVSNPAGYSVPVIGSLSAVKLEESIILCRNWGDKSLWNGIYNRKI